MEKLWWPKRVLLVSFLNSKFLFYIPIKYLVGLKTIFLRSRSDRCFRLGWPMDPKADFFRHSDITKSANTVLVIFLSTTSTLGSFIFIFYTVQAPLFGREEAERVSFITMYWWGGPFFFCQKKKKWILWACLPFCYLFYYAV